MIVRLFKLLEAHNIILHYFVKTTYNFGLKQKM